MSKDLLAGIAGVVMLLMVSGDVFGQPLVSTVQTGAPPAWVEMVEPDSTAVPKPDQEAGGQFIKLMDAQVNIATGETYLHLVKEITTEAGVQSGANLEFTWDPSFQELIVHRIIILRGTERMDRLEPTRFKIIQQETDLNRQIYNGTLSAVLFLDDVRVGDRIEYDYTWRGQNPSMKDNFSDTLLLGLPMPMQHRRVRVLWPEGRHLNYASHGVTIEPEIRHHDGIGEYIWDLHQVPAVMAEDQTPSWVTPYPWLQLSEFTNWANVATWGTALFSVTNSEAAEVQQMVRDLQSPGLTSEQTVQGALEFVQNKVRYLGIEFGPNSYRPSDPAMVLRRRFGDCKDKALLLCVLLRELGYEATPALVATGFRQTLPDLLPAPQDFDHVIVRVVASGNTYWVDPTLSYQRGPITQRQRPPYSFGLLVKSGETSLTAIPASDQGAPHTVTTEVFRVGGQKAPTGLSVTTTYAGSDAEWMRAVLAAEGRERLAKSYLNDYAQRYSGTTPVAPIAVQDSTNSDTLTVIQNYSISNFWVLSTDKQIYNCQFYPLGIHGWIAKPATTVRVMPMELSFPRERLVKTKVELPMPFKISNFTNTIVGPGADLHIERTSQGQTVWLKYEYQARTNFVPISLVADHFASLDRMENALTYTLAWQSMDGIGKVSQFNWPIFLLAVIYAMSVASGAGILCYKQCNKPVGVANDKAQSVDAKLEGLGGWLVLICFGLIIKPIQLLLTMSQTSGSFSLWKWHSLTMPGGASYNPIWGPLLTLELLGHISLLIVDICALVLFFQKRRSFPIWFISLLVLQAIFIIGDTLGVHILGTASPAIVAKTTRNLMSVAVGCSIWIPYMLVSKRVKVTFVR